MHARAGEGSRKPPVSSRSPKSERASERERERGRESGRERERERERETEREREKERKRERDGIRPEGPGVPPSPPFRPPNHLYPLSSPILFSPLLAERRGEERERGGMEEGWVGGWGINHQSSVHLPIYSDHRVRCSY